MTLHEVECLIWYDGPQLGVYAATSGEQFLAVHTLDVPGYDYPMLVAPLSVEQRLDLISARKSLRSIFVEAGEHWYWDLGTDKLCGCIPDEKEFPGDTYLDV